MRNPLATVLLAIAGLIVLAIVIIAVTGAPAWLVVAVAVVAAAASYGVVAGRRT